MINESAMAANAIGSQGEVAKSSEAIRRAAPRDHGPEDDADQGKQQGLREYLALHTAARGSESHTHADFLSLLSNGVRDDSVDAEGGEQMPSLAKSVTSRPRSGAAKRSDPRALAGDERRPGLVVRD